MADAYIPAYAPFHTEPDGFRVWEGARPNSFIVANDHNGNTYRGDLKGVAIFIQRERGGKHGR